MASRNAFVLWAPRVLTIAFAAFISIFAADVFEHGVGFWKTLGALLLHLIPTFLVLLVLVLSWRREWVGAIAFFALGLAYIVMMWGRFPLATYVVIAGPLFLAGILFLVSWLLRGQTSPAPQT